MSESYVTPPVDAAASGPVNAFAATAAPTTRRRSGPRWETSRARVLWRLHPARARALATIAVTLLPIAYVLVASFPGVYLAPNRGLDESWIYVFNYLVNREYLIGRDIVYTYGPLGFLLWTMPSGENIPVAGAFGVLVQLLFGVLLVYHALQQRSLTRVLLFAATYVIARMVAFQYEYQLIVLVGLLLAMALDERRARVPCLVIAGVLSAVLLFTKLGTGAIAGLLIVGFAVVAARDGLARAGTGLVIVGATYVATAAVLAVAFIQSVPGLMRWVSIYAEISGGYDSAMSLEYPEFFILLGLLALGAYLIATGVLLYRRSDVARMACIFALPLMLSFKHGYVRGPYLFLSFCLATISFMIVRSYTSRDLKVTVTTFLVVLMVALPIVTYERMGWLRGANDVVLGTRGSNTLLLLRHYRTSTQRMRDTGERLLQVDRLPPEWVTPMRDTDATVDVFPWEIGYITANGLRWSPNPLVQAFIAYTAALDQVSATHFAGAQAPEYLLVDWTNVDGQHPMTGSPVSWRTILANYEVARLAPAGQPIGLGAGFLQLKRRAEPWPNETSVLATADVDPAAPIAVPPVDGVLFAALDLELTPLSRATKTVFRVPPVYMDTQLASGRTTHFKIVPDTLRGGIVINYLPTSVEEYAALSQGAAADRVVGFTLSGPGLEYYVRPARLTWRQAPWPVRGPVR